MFKRAIFEYKNCKTKWKETYLEFLCAIIVTCIDIPENDKVESANCERHYFSYFNVDSFFTKIYGL